MSLDDDTDDYMDALIEDTTRCKLCGASLLLGGNEALVLDAIRETPCVCIECADEVTKAYKLACKDSGICTADDDNPADNTWKLSCGFRRCIIATRLVIDRPGTDDQELYIDADGECGLSSHEDGAFALFIAGTKWTRGDVRRLLAALGIALKASTPP